MKFNIQIEEKSYEAKAKSFTRNINKYIYVKYILVPVTRKSMDHKNLKISSRFSYIIAYGF